MEPVVVRGRERLVGGVVHVERRRDVDDAQLLDALGMVDREPVRHAPAPVVSAQEEALATKRVHHADEVERHRAFAVVAVVGQPRRLGGIAVPAQVGEHDEVVLPQRLRHAVPHHVSLWEAVQQQHGGTLRVAAEPTVDRGAVDVEVPRLEAVEPTRRVR